MQLDEPVAQAAAARIVGIESVQFSEQLTCWGSFALFGR